jgi:Zn-finger nucleic acid-binding protein
VIVACPACDARYDLAGRPVGSQARCRCGTVFTIEAPAAHAAVLACPRCGASVPESSAACAHCRAALLVKACPRCLARVFHGHRHCPQCGVGLDQAAATAATHRTCPRCRVDLIAHLVGDVALDDCPQCGGTFVERATLERLLSERREARAGALLGAYDAAGDAPLPVPSGSLYIRCPDCATVMNRKQFARGAHVIVDVCRAHGTWFDAHELPRIVRFVMTGGLEQAAHKELADEREKVRRMMADAATAQARASHRTPSMASHDYGTLIADVLFQLWK